MASENRRPRKILVQKKEKLKRNLRKFQNMVAASHIRPKKL